MTDRQILQPLAARVAEIAADPSQTERRARFCLLNDLQQVRPVVLIDELPWNQLDFDGSLTLHCQDPVLRDVECRLRRTVFQWEHFQGDMVVPPVFEVQKHINAGRITPETLENTLSVDAGNNIISHLYLDQLADESAISLLTTPTVTVDEEASRRDMEKIGEAIGDVLPLCQVGLGYAGAFMPWDDFARCRGVEAILTDLVERPEYLLDLVDRYTQCALARLDQLEAMGLIRTQRSDYIHCTAGLCNDLPEVTGGPATRKDIWGRGTAQIFAAVSPAMHQEFEIEFAKRFFAGFTRVYYGCCEPLHNKIDIVRKLPNVTKISITPWADVDVAADRMGGDFVMAWKPNPALLAQPNLDEDALRAEVRRALAACRRNGTPMEITLKDISSVCYRPENVTRWAQIVTELRDN